MNKQPLQQAVRGQRGSTSRYRRQKPVETDGVDQTHRHLPRAHPHQGTVLHILSEQAVVIQGVLGFASHTVHGTLVHLMLNPSEEHVQRLAHRVLWKCGRSGPLAGGESTRGMLGKVLSLAVVGKLHGLLGTQCPKEPDPP